MKPLLALHASIVLLSAGTMASAQDFARDLSTDRPDATESPYTVEPGRWQVEFEAVRWGHDRESGITIDTFNAGAINLKHGLADQADVQVIFEPYTRVRTRFSGTTTTVDGFGDTVVRLKLNLRGNEGDGSAWGLMPFIKLPTADDDLGNGNVEGGLIIPFAFTLSEHWGCGVMAEVDLVRNDADNGYETAFVTTATVATEVASSLGWFAELTHEAVGSDSSNWAATFNTGFTYALSPNRQLDAGVNLGLTDAAEDRAFFLGYSTRW